MEGDAIDQKISNEQSLNEENNPRVERLGEEYNLPQIFDVGIAFDPYRKEMHRITVSATANDPNDNQVRSSYGIEYAFRELLILRGGFKAGYDEQMFSLGLGANFDYSGIKSRFDYAYSDFGILGNIHYLTFRIGF